MGLMRSGLRRLAVVVAGRVSRNGLFEQEGERAPTSPLAPVSTQPGVRGSAGRGSGSSVGCEKADLELATAAHAPGSRPRLVNHWATWCLPCVDELPLLVSLAERLGERVEVMGVSWDLFDPRGSEDDIVEHVARFADGNGMTWPSLLVTAPPRDFFRALGLSNEQVPQTLLIGTDGSVLYHVEGVLSDADCARIETLVGEAA